VAYGDGLENRCRCKPTVGSNPTPSAILNVRTKMDNMNQYVIKLGYANMDFTKVTAMLATSYWTPGIKIDEVKKGAKNSALLVGVFNKREQIGYARVISDKIRFAYILDVFVDERYRKKGIGQLMINKILNHPDLKDVYQWMLITRDAHGVYGKSGFKPLTRANDWMEIRKERPKR
jgi:GNAT superfamily N-acetyltransferase